MRITIEDLEALRELNDELEETHVETERQLQEDVGTSDVVRGITVVINQTPRHEGH